MHEPRPTDTPTVLPPDGTPSPTHVGQRPSRLIPFVSCGSTSLILFAVAGALRRGHEAVWVDLGAYSCLGACLSGVASAIFGCVTLSRAIRRRRKAATRGGAGPGRATQRGA